ncbi:MAG: GNAT family N-acetyltransferase [Micromonosporaceae bacterium]|jgi:GNAT superfamily N-acetyltransferase
MTAQPDTGLSIRLAHPDDLPAVAELRWRWTEERGGRPLLTRAEFIPRFVAWAEENRATHRCVVALRNGTVVGMAWLAVMPRVPQPRSFERASGDLQSVYVVPSERDRGTGGALVDAVLTLARDLGLERVVVHSSQRAVGVYARHGFTSDPTLLHVDLRAAT